MSQEIVNAIVLSSSPNPPPYNTNPIPPSPRPFCSLWYRRRSHVDNVRRWAIHHDTNVSIPYRPSERAHSSVVELALVLILPCATIDASDVQLVDSKTGELTLQKPITITKRSLVPMATKNPKTAINFLTAHFLSLKTYVIPLQCGQMFAYDIRVRLNVASIHAQPNREIEFRVKYRKKFNDGLLCHVSTPAFTTKSVPAWLIVSTSRNTKKRPRARVGTLDISPSPPKRRCKSIINARSVDSSEQLVNGCNSLVPFPILRSQCMYVLPPLRST